MNGGAFGSSHWAMYTGNVAGQFFDLGPTGSSSIRRNEMNHPQVHVERRNPAKFWLGPVRGDPDIDMQRSQPFPAGTHLKSAT
jgi:hypothetical protein